MWEPYRKNLRLADDGGLPHVLGTTMVTNQNDPEVLISEDEARGGVTGHHVRYVLAFGLAGIVIAFIVIGLYFGFDALTLRVSNFSAAEGVWQRLLLYAILLALAPIAVALLLALWNMVWGHSANASQTVMRWRVVLQFIAVCLVMAALYLSHLF
jgi:Hypoxia induced protein conserved region